MAWSGNYRLRLDDCALKSVAGSRVDLRVVEEMLEYCLDTAAEIHDVCEELEEACWTTAIVRYHRAFDQRGWPVRTTVLDQLSSEQLEAHHFFRYLRDKMYGHVARGLGEDFEVTAHVFTDSFGAPRISGLGSRPRRISSPGTDLAHEFISLVRCVRPLVDTYMEAEKGRLLRELVALPIEQAVRGTPVDQTPLHLTKADPNFRKYLAGAT